MQTLSLISFVLGALLAGAALWFSTRGASEQLRRAEREAREREADAKSRASDAERRSDQMAEELKQALSERGKYQAEAARVGETRDTLAQRENEIRELGVRIENLDREKTVALKDAEAATQQANIRIAGELDTQKRILAAKDEQIAQLRQFISGAREALTAEFEAVSSKALKGAQDELLKTANGLIKQHGDSTTADVNLRRQQIETMLKPVEETIKRLDQHVTHSDLARTAAEALLNEQVNRLATASEGLTSALRKPVIRGSWGEMTLENALRNAGLEPEIDFVLQHSTDKDDNRQRTDAIINLPKGRKLIIDSKNLMDSYIAFANAEDQASKAELADIHARSLRNHIRALSEKKYWERYDGLDCVILFIPHDGMYHAAIQDEAELIRYASDRRVFITNPMSLIPLLKAVGYVLDQERLNKSAEEIKRVGVDLYAEITRFAESMATIGKRLKSTVTAYNDAIPGLDRYILAKSRTLKQLGSGKGAEAEVPEAIEIEPRLFSARELRPTNLFLEDDEVFDLAASTPNAVERDS